MPMRACTNEAVAGSGRSGVHVATTSRSTWRGAIPAASRARAAAVVARAAGGHPLAIGGEAPGRQDAQAAGVGGHQQGDGKVGLLSVVVLGHGFTLPRVGDGFVAVLTGSRAPGRRTGRPLWNAPRPPQI